MQHLSPDYKQHSLRHCFINMGLLHLNFLGNHDFQLLMVEIPGSWSSRLSLKSQFMLYMMVELNNGNICASLISIMCICRLLMGKEEVSTADSYYLHIKHIDGNSWDSFRRGMLEGHMESSQMFLENAMCRWVKLYFGNFIITLCDHIISSVQWILSNYSGRSIHQNWLLNFLIR